MGHFHYSPHLYINKHSLLQYIQCFDIDFYSGPTQVKAPPCSTVLSPTSNIVNKCLFEAIMTGKSIKGISRQHTKTMLGVFCMLSSVPEIGHQIFQCFEYTEYSGSKANAKVSLCALLKIKINKSKVV